VKTSDLFRPEARRKLDEPDVGSALNVTPCWLPVTSWLLVVAGIGMIALAASIRLPVYETGFAVVHLGATDATAIASCSSKRQARGGLRGDPMFVALVDGNSRPKLIPGMRVLLRVSGYRDGDIPGSVDSVGDGVLDADELRSLPGTFGATPTTVPGPVVAVCGHLESDHFRSDGTEYTLQDDMTATARVRLRDERPIDRLLPRAR